METAGTTSLELPLIGVESEHCALIVDKGIASLHGVRTHRVELNNERAVVTYDLKETNAKEIISTIRGLGYDVATEKKTFPVTGMSCASCALSVESMLSAQPGVVSASVNVANNSTLIEYIPGVADIAEMKNSVQSIGYDMVIEEKAGDESVEAIHQRHYRNLKMKTIWSAALSFPVVIIGMFFMNDEVPYGNWIMMALTAPVLFWFGRSFFVNAVKQARHRQANMDTLVALSTGIAFVFSTFNTLNPDFWHQRGLHAHVYFEAAAVVITFILLGKLLEERAKSSTSASLKKLIGLQPKTVLVINEHGEPVEKNVAYVNVNDIILIRPGDKIPVDGIVINGSSFVDESMINGEPLPSAKTENSKVFAGTVNQKGSFQFKAEKVGGETVLAQIIKTVQDAQGSKAPVQKQVDKIAGIFVPIVISISLLSFASWMILGGENGITYGLLAMVTVLVIACPCALGLATPTAIMVGIGKGAEHGILIKDAESLERAFKTNIVILDKTGTITQGRPEVKEIVWQRENAEQYLQSVLYALESRSDHPLATAVTDYTKSVADKPAVLSEIENIPGKGIRARSENNLYAIGNLALLQEVNVTLSEEQSRLAQAFQEQANTVVFFAENNSVVAIIAIADKIKPSSKEAVQMLQRNGIEVIMLTGDNSHTASAVAREVGISSFQSNMLPGDKADFVRSLQKSGKVVAMVGDGINDSQALALADVSIAMAKGSDLAIDVSRITLMSSDLLQIPRALKLSKITVRTIHQNLFWAFIYNIIGIPLAAGILFPINGFMLNPMIAGAAMALSSVSVVANSLTLKAKNLN